MAVETGAGPVERALDEIARSIESPPFDLGDQLIAALACSALWRVVFDGAMRDGDPKLARIAADQIRNAHEAYRGLAAISDERKTLDLVTPHPPFGECGCATIEQHHRGSRPPP